MVDGSKDINALYFLIFSETTLLFSFSRTFLKAGFVKILDNVLLLKPAGITMYKSIGDTKIAKNVENVFLCIYATRPLFRHLFHPPLQKPNIPDKLRKIIKRAHFRSRNNLIHARV